MRVFVTGATGCLGEGIVKKLKGRGYDVVGLVRTADSARLLEALGCKVVIGDITQPGLWQQEASTAEGIIHAAWVRPGRRLGMKWVHTAAAADVIAIHKLIEAAKKGNRCRALIYTSAVAAYGSHGDAWIDESTASIPGAIGQAHFSSEQFVMNAYRDGVPAFCFRPGTFYGSTGSFAKFFLAEAQKGKLSYVGPGDNYMSFIHIHDVAEAYVLALECPPVGQVLSIVDDEPIRMREMSELVLKTWGGGKVSSAPVWLVALFAGRPLAELLSGSYRVKNNKVKLLLGWKPSYPTVRQGLKDVIAEFRNFHNLHG